MKSLLGALGVCAFALLTLPGTASASRDSLFLANFICGVNPANVRAVPGFYAFAATVTNVDTRAAEVEIGVALSFPPATPVAPVAPAPETLVVTLGPGESLGVDCQEILDPAVFGVDVPKYAKGHLTVRTERRGALAVSGIQRVSELVEVEEDVFAPGLPASLDVSRIPEIRVRD